VLAEDDFANEVDDADVEEAGDEEPSTPQGYKNYVSAKGFAALRAEYHELFHNERPKLVETVAWAASNGDRSENGDYIYGKRRLREIDRRLRFLGRRMQNAQVVISTDQSKGPGKDRVQFGAQVTTKDDDGKKFVYRIVGEDEIDIDRRRISWVSPIAKALMGAKKGDVVTVKRPTGELDLTIIKIEYPGDLD
jgi:transcription elongation factor GreB